MRRTAERGSALLVALGILVLLSMMGVTFVILARMEMRAAANFDAMVRARFLAEAGIERAMAELRDLYVGPVFRPRYTPAPGDPDFLNPNSPRLEIAKPYYSTLAAAECETWGAFRSIEVRPGVNINYTQDTNFTLPDPVSDESAPYLWSGPRYGRLSEGYFDGRFQVQPTQVSGFDGTSGETFRVSRGVVDLCGLININRPDPNDNLANLLEGLFVYFGSATFPNPAALAAAIVNSRQDNAAGIPQRPFRYLHELVDRGLLTMDQLYGEDANGNGRLDSGEDANGNGVLDGALRDVLTVYPITGGSEAVNINTASEPVLFAVFYVVLGRDPTKAHNLARAVIRYRAGADTYLGVLSEAGGVGNLNGDMDQNDIVSDDDPFDGVLQSRALWGLPPAGVGNGLPEFADDGLDNDGDTIAQVIAGAPIFPSAARAFDRYLCPNGPGGFSEFEYFMDTFGPGLGLSAAEIDRVKYNAARRDDIVYGTPPPVPRVVTAPFRYDSDCWQVTCEGVVERGGEVAARSTLCAVVYYR